MAGAMRKVGEYLGLVEQAGRFDDEFDDRADAGSDAHASSVRAPRPVRAVRDDESMTVARLDEHRRPGQGSHDAASVATPATPAEVSRITTLHPRNYNEARTLGERFREGIPVIMNLSEMDDSDAKRLVDFAAGLVFAVHGTIERITSKVFLLSPANVSVAAEEKQRIAEGGFFNQS